MYNDFYGFRESPFNITPDPRFLFLSQKHREAINHLLFGLLQRKGFIQLTGEVGTGKTTICRLLLQELPRTFHTALILNPCLSETQLLRSILEEFGVKPPRRDDRVALLRTLNDFLLEQLSTGHDVVLIIDEAQDMTFELLEQVRLLSNLETDQRKLLQIVLIGQPELRRKLEDPRVRQLRQRITVRYHLRPLTLAETRQYVRQRLHTAGGNGEPRFTPLALWRMYRYAQGIPRLINAACDKSLLAGYVAGEKVLSFRSVGRALRELEGLAA